MISAIFPGFLIPPKKYIFFRAITSSSSPAQLSRLKLSDFKQPVVCKQTGVIPLLSLQTFYN